MPATIPCSQDEEVQNCGGVYIFRFRVEEYGRIAIRTETLRIDLSAVDPELRPDRLVLAEDLAATEIQATDFYGGD
jgi:hypothetical protein